MSLVTTILETTDQFPELQDVIQKINFNDSKLPTKRKMDTYVESILYHIQFTPSVVKLRRNIEKSVLKLLDVRGNIPDRTPTQSNPFLKLQKGRGQELRELSPQELFTMIKPAVNSHVSNIKATGGSGKINITGVVKSSEYGNLDCSIGISVVEEGSDFYIELNVVISTKMGNNSHVDDFIRREITDVIEDRINRPKRGIVFDIG